MKYTNSLNEGCHQAATALKVGVVTETFPPEINGVAKTLARIIGSLAEKGHAIHLVRPRQGKDDAAIDAGVETTTLVSGMAIPWYPCLRIGSPAFIRLSSLWKRNKPDILYVATEGPLGLAAVLVARRLGIPVISGFHTNFPSYSAHYRLGLLKPLIMGYLRFFHNRTASTLVPTDALQEELLQQRFAAVDVMGRGVDLELFSPDKRCRELRRSWGLEEDESAVLYVGRLATEKNIHLALRAFDRMRRIDPRLRFIFVGDGPIRHELGDTRAELLFVGEHTGESLARHYASADIFLFSSETETFGNVTLEAMASGLALVAFDYAAGHEIGRHGHNGLFVPLGSDEQFIDAAVTLVEDRSLANQLKQNARETTKSCSWQGICDRFESLLLEYCENGIFADPVRQDTINVQQ